MSETPAGDEIPDLFARALELEGEERRRFVATLTARDPASGAAISRLLDRADDPESPLDRSPWAEWAAAGAAAVELPERIGPYRIERELGSGGMGRVFLAVEETADFSRPLALKVIDRPLADANSIRRFRDEVRILSLLEHPGIARFLHGGRSPEGIWYLALEYVDGVDLLTWAAEKNLDRDQRVRLFLAVLEPVRYAHQHGIVHRDLKPGHLLIDRAGRPRLLDFGISKLVDPEGDTAVTRTEARTLTPAYASPEQFQGGTISPATDVFALGVVLYELLAGRRPFEPATRSAAAFEQAVLQTEPAAPSSVLRGGPALGKDLDAICLKALRKRPEERYRDAGEFAADLERSLAGRAVSARRGAMRRAVTGTLRRHRVAFAGAALLFVFLSALLVGRAASRGPGAAAGPTAPAEPSPAAFPFARIASSEISELERAFAADPGSLRAGALLALALDQKRRLPEAKLIASRLRQLPGAAGDPLLDYVDATLATSSDEPQRALLLFTQARDGAIARGRGELVGQIRASRGRLLSTLGERAEAYREMDLARGDFERAGDFESLGRVLNDLAIEHLIGGELAQGQDLLERAIAAARKAGAPPTIMLHNLGQLATFRGDPAEGEANLREVVADRRREGNPFRVGEALAAHAEALDDLGRRDEAVADLDEAATILRQADDKSALVSALYLRGAIAVSADQLDRIPGIAAELEACGTQTGGYLGLISAYALRGLAADARGDLAGLRREFGTAEQLAISKGHLDFAAVTEANHAAAELRAGADEAAQATALRALGRLPEGSATSAPMALAQSVLARLDAAAGRLEAGGRRLAPFADDAAHSTSVSRRIALLSAQASLARASGQAAAGASALDQAIDLARGAGRRFEQRDLLRARGR